MERRFVASLAILALSSLVALGIHEAREENIEEGSALVKAFKPYNKEPSTHWERLWGLDTDNDGEVDRIKVFSGSIPASVHKPNFSKFYVNKNERSFGNYLNKLDKYKIN